MKLAIKKNIIIFIKTIKTNKPKKKKKVFKK